MSCMSCNTASNEARLKLSVVDGVLCGTFDGVPFAPVTLPGSGSTSGGRYFLDTDTCETVFETEEFVSSGGTSGVRYDESVSTILACGSIHSLGDVSSATPTVDCSVLTWDDTTKQWTTRVIETGTLVSNVGLDADGCLVKEDVCDLSTSFQTLNALVGINDTVATGGPFKGQAVVTDTIQNTAACAAIVTLHIYLRTCVGSGTGPYSMRLGGYLDTSLPNVTGQTEVLHYGIYSGNADADRDVTNPTYLTTEVLVPAGSSVTVTAGLWVDVITGTSLNGETSAGFPAGTSAPYARIERA